MDIERFQVIDKWLAKQVEATHITNKNLTQLFWMISTKEAKYIAPTPPAPAIHTPPIITTLSALQPSQIRPSAPNDFDRDQSEGQAFLTLCEIYTSLTASDFPDDKMQIHWALSYCKSRRAVNFAKNIIRQEMKTGKMVINSWTELRDEFTSIFCPENEATMVLMMLKSDQY
jgi:hypothetical protein